MRPPTSANSGSSSSSSSSPRFRPPALGFQQGLRFPRIVPLPSPMLQEQFTILSHLQQAIFGSVVKAQRKADGQLVAIKILDRALVRKRVSVADVPVCESAEVEMTVLQKSAQMPHPNVLGSTNATGDRNDHQVLHDRDAIYCITPFCDGGELFEHIQSHGAAPVAQAVELLQGVVRGVQHLHTKLGYVHNDISPENVFLQSNVENASSSFVPVLADFGLATPIGLPARAVPGKAAYQAPEVLYSEGGDRIAHPASDVFSLGVVFFVTLTATMPYDRPNTAQCPKYAEIQHGANSFAAVLAQWNVLACSALAAPINRPLLQLICRMLSEDPRRRPSLDCVLSVLANVQEAAAVDGEEEEAASSSFSSSSLSSSSSQASASASTYAAVSLALTAPSSPASSASNKKRRRIGSATCSLEIPVVAAPLSLSFDEADFSVFDMEEDRCSEANVCETNGWGTADDEISAIDLMPPSQARECSLESLGRRRQCSLDESIYGSSPNSVADFATNFEDFDAAWP